MKFKKTEVWGFKHAIRGMRNPLNSHSKSDSTKRSIGKKDMELAQRLIKAGSEHRKFMRQIFVSVDITAPLYWFKELDTYKISTVANSTSTMHKLATTPITIDCFEVDDYNDGVMSTLEIGGQTVTFSSNQEPLCIIDWLESLRKEYLRTSNKKYWKELIRWLPESWLQTRTVTMNYENIYSMIRQRKNHKLNEWSGKDDSSKDNFISWCRTLPYADSLLFLELEDSE